MPNTTSRESEGKISQKGKLLTHWLPPLAWMALIFFLSSRPDLPHYPEALIDLILKKLAHVVEYAVLAFLWWRAFYKWRKGPMALTMAFVLAFLYALSDEYHQKLVPGRHPSLLDVGFDSLGAFIALAFVRRRISNRAEG